MSLAKETEVENIHILGYSAGSRVVISALGDFAFIHFHDNRDTIYEKLKINQVILAGSDVDRDIFANHFDDGLLKIPQNLSIYVSGADKALGMSKWFFSRPRLGQISAADPIDETALKALRKLDRLKLAARAFDHVVLVVFLHKASGTLHRRGIDDGIQHVRIQVERIDLHCLVEPLAHRQNTLVGEGRVLLHEVAQNVVQIPEAVVDRGRREKDHVPSLATEQTTKDSSPLRCVWVPVVVRLVNHDEGIILQRILQDERRHMYD